MWLFIAILIHIADYVKSIFSAIGAADQRLTYTRACSRGRLPAASRLMARRESAGQKMARAQGFAGLIGKLRFVWRRGIYRKDITRVPCRGCLMRGYDFQQRSCSGHSSAPKTFETYGRNLRTCDAYQTILLKSNGT
jgi:hypothetical protein